MIHNGKKYSSKKHPMLEAIFFHKFKGDANLQKSITFTLLDISNAYAKCGIQEPASISNTILDLCRQDRGISSRVPDSISTLGYDLRKKTGNTTDGGSFAGEFLYVGVGNEIRSWLIWPDNFDRELTIDSSKIPESVLPLLRNDEGALFSVIDYCDVLSRVLGEDPKVIIRVQNPMKWQPNEIDGFYINQHTNTIHPVEAKALTTNDDINLEQLNGGNRVVHFKYKDNDICIQYIAAKMTKNGIAFALYKKIEASAYPADLVLDSYVKVKFFPPIKAWL